MTNEEKLAAKAAKKAEKEAAKAAANSASSSEAEPETPASAPKYDDNWWKSLGYKDPQTGINLVLADRPQSDKAWIMAKFLSECEKIRTIYPCDEGEKPGKAVAIKTRNGFRVNIVKGVPVYLPDVIVYEIEKSFSDTEAAKNHTLVIEDPITHQKIAIQTNVENADPKDRAMLGG